MTMRIAILSDIHGNSIALDAVLADAANSGEIDSYWVIGDLVAVGFDPIGVMERLDALPNAICTKGNTDTYALNGVADNAPDPKPTSESEWRHQIAISRSFGWVSGMLWSIQKQQFLASLPNEIRTVLPDGTSTLAIHASPNMISGGGFRPDYDEATIHERMADADADLVFVGHTHFPINRMVADVHLVNIGCVGNPTLIDMRAQYVILTADETGYSVEHRYVSYDLAACVSYCESSRFPEHNYVGMHYRDGFRPKWYSGYTLAELNAFLPIPNKKYKRS